MALPLGKLTIIIGAGLVGSVLAKEGRMPSFYDVYSGASKILKLISADEKTTPNPKPHNDALRAQVDILRRELQIIAANRPVTIVTSTTSGNSKYGIIIIIVVAGYGYVWWKGWKLPDLMFATKRSLSDATGAIAKQLENVYSSIAATKRHLSSRIDRVDCSLDECAQIVASTKEEVSALRGDTKVIAMDVQSVHHAVYTLETKLNRIEGKQDDTNLGVARLLRTAVSLEKQAQQAQQIQANPSSSSRPALELPERALSMPQLRIEELSSPPTPPQVKRPLESAISASGLKALHGNPEIVESENTPRVSNGSNSPDEGNSNSRVFGRTFSSIGAVFLRARPPNRQ